MRTVKDQLERAFQVDSNLTLGSDIFLLINTRVPLLVAQLSNGITVDIQFPARDYHSLRNTNLLRHYAAVTFKFIFQYS
jgi:hypothetical protein